MDERSDQDAAQADQEPLKDLDVETEDADKVMGGRAKVADPCDGGE